MRLVDCRRTKHCLSRGSRRASLSSNPSVTYRILVMPVLYVESKHTEYPKSESSLDTRSASVIAAIRGGCEREFDLRNYQEERGTYLFPS